MIDVNTLKGVIVAKGYTQQDIAKVLGIAPKTFYLKMKRGVFGSDEMEKMIETLDIENPASIFFARERT